MTNQLIHLPLRGVRKFLFVMGMAVAALLLFGGQRADAYTPWIEEGELSLLEEGSPAWNHSRTDTRVVCVGDGIDGARVVFLWVTENPKSEVPVKKMRQTAAWMDRIVADSAKIHSGAFQTIRWQHTKPNGDGCQVVPEKLVVPKGTIGPAKDPGAGYSRVAKAVQKYHDSTGATGGRRYIIWFDRTFAEGTICGQGGHFSYPETDSFPGADTPDPEQNPHNDPDVVLTAQVYCPGNYRPTELHELMHTLGAVQPTAKHYWDNNGAAHGHAGDGYDIMAYLGKTDARACKNREWSRLLDCGGDDYYAPGKKIIGRNGKEIWNIANSMFLQSERPAWWVDFDPIDGSGQGTKQRPRRGVFSDDDDSVFEADIETLAAAGVTRGCNPPTNDRFCPDDVVTRGQMAAFLRRAFPDLEVTDPNAGKFTDTKGSVFADDVAWLAKTGVTRGCGPDKFCPDQPVTRGQMAAFLGRALGLANGNATFVDTKGHLFQGEVAALAEAGITKGCNPPTNDRFCPDDVVTRGQMAAFLVRAGIGS